MKVGLVLSASPGYSETFFNSKIKGLIEKGFSVTLFCQNISEDFNLCSVKKLPSGSKNRLLNAFNIAYVLITLLPFARRVFKFYSLEKKDSQSFITIIKKVYFNAQFLKSNLDWLHFGFGTLALGRENAAASIKAKMAVSFRGFDIGVYPLKHKGCYKQLWKKVDKIHVISEDIRELLYSNNFKNEAQVVKITPAIDTSFFHPKKSNPNSILHITTVARLHWKKGLDYTIRALAQLKQRGIEFKYTVIGEGVEMEYLKYLTNTLGLSSSVHFKGRLDHNIIKNILNCSDIYLQYSVHEGFCNAVLEAQAMGLLCVVSDAEGLSENVINGKTGWVLKKRQPNLLSEKIEEITKLSRKEKDEIKTRAQEHVKRNFGISKQQEAFVKFYKLDA